MQVSGPAAELVERLLAPAPDPDQAARYLARLRQEAPEGFERIVGFAHGPARGHRGVLVQ